MSAFHPIKHDCPSCRCAEPLSPEESAALGKPTNPELLAALEAAAGYEMSDEEIAEQKASWVRGQVGGPKTSVVMQATPSTTDARYAKLQARYDSLLAFQAGEVGEVIEPLKARNAELEEMVDVLGKNIVDLYHDIDAARNDALEEAADQVLERGDAFKSFGLDGDYKHCTVIAEGIRALKTNSKG